MSEFRSYTEKTHAAFHGQAIDTSDPRVLAWLIRRHGLEMTHISRGSHIGAIFSAAEVMATLYTGVLNVDPQNPKMEGRDRLILSKGHAGACVYAALAERGFFPVEELSTHYANGSRLSGHVSHKGIPGVEFSTGSLGHGLAVGAGMALGAKLNKEDWRTYVVMGDGELAEGSVWEGAMSASHYGLDNLCAVVDRNRLQISGPTEEVMHQDSVEARFAAFGWNALSVDGNDNDALCAAFDAAKAAKGKPTLVVANTTKDKGSPVMENKAS
jgi:transketolase